MPSSAVAACSARCVVRRIHLSTKTGSAVSAAGARHWYEVIGETMESLTNANEKFAKGGLNGKSEVLLVIGQNPVLIDGK